MGLKDVLSHIVLKFLVVPKSPEVLPDKTHIACIGDSITFGAGVNGETEKTWEYFLNQRLGDSYQVINYGISGRTLQDEGDYPYTADKFYPESLGCQAEYYLIMLGTNDAKPYNWNEGRYERELEVFCQAYLRLNHQPVVILMTPPTCYADPETGVVGYDIQAEFVDESVAPIVRRMAEELGLPCIDLHAYTQGHSEWFGDGVHPNELGNGEIAAYIAEQLQL